MSVAMPWEVIGRVVVLICSWLVVMAVMAVAELYWPGMYEFVVEGLLMLALTWLIFWRKP